ncbi:MAG: winged helix-turn-helix transcriptional regulator [Planctomycetota bacterium]
MVFDRRQPCTTHASSLRYILDPSSESIYPVAAKSRLSEPPVKTWTFLTNHAHVLIVLHAHPDMVLRQVAIQVGITERAVQRIVQDLEDEGFIVREKVGRQNRYEVRTDVPLRHPIESHRNIGDLLKLITG